MPKKNRLEVVDSDDEPKETEDKHVRVYSNNLDTFLTPMRLFIFKNNCFLIDF